MIDPLLRSLGPAAVSLLALALARRASASVRHLLALAGLAATLAVPLFVAVLPSMRFTVLRAPVVAPARDVTIPSAAPAFAPPVPTVPAPLAPAPRPFPWAVLWACGSLVLALRWAFGWLWLCARLRRAVRIEGLDAPLPVFECNAFRLPVTAWAGRPAIVLPPGWRDWPAGRLDLVLRHEVAHVRRGDGLSLLLARLALAVLWPNPLVWLLARAESRLAERAVDDLVLSEGVPAPRYAEALLDLAREPRANGSLPALGMAAKAQVAHRVEMILNPKTSRTPVSRGSRRTALSLALLAAVPVAVLGFDARTGETLVASVPSAETTDRPVLLECRVIRTDVEVPRAALPLSAEPAFVRSPRSLLLTSPTLRVLPGESRTVSVTTGASTLTLALRPEVDRKGGLTLWSASSLSVGGRARTTTLTSVPTGRNGLAMVRLESVPLDPRAYVALIRVVPQAPSAPAAPSSREPSVSVAPIAVANPIAFRLRARVVRASGLSGAPTVGSPTEPAIGQSDPSRVVDAPDLYTGDGVPTALRITLDGKVHTVTIRPDTGDDFRCVVQVGDLAKIGGESMGYNNVWYRTRADEWIRYPLTELGGRATGYHLLLQITPYKGDGPSPRGRASDAPPAPRGKPNLAPATPSAPTATPQASKTAAANPPRSMIVRKADGRVEILHGR